MWGHKPKQDPKPSYGALMAAQAEATAINMSKQAESLSRDAQELAARLRALGQKDTFAEDLTNSMRRKERRGA